MGFRIVVIKSRAKLEARLNSLIVRGEVERKVFLDEINTLIVQSTAVSLTASLLCELTRRNIKVIFCDEKCNPSSELLPYYGSHNTSGRYRDQIGWSNENKGRVWCSIIRKKISEQAAFLAELNYPEQAAMLYEYASAVEPHDRTNREGHAAKVYFNCILGEGSRRSGGFVNGCLNYGYAVILSACNREIAAAGYFTQLGIWHDNEFNEFNFGCDLMEVLRVAVDRRALALTEGDPLFKRKMADILNCKAVMEGKNTTLDVAIRTYVRSVFRALHNGRAEEVVFPEEIDATYEL